MAENNNNGGKYTNIMVFARRKLLPYRTLLN